MYLNSLSPLLRKMLISLLVYNVFLQPEQQTEDLLALTESWFHLLSNQPMDMIRNISTQPFPELHCGALRIFTVSVELFLSSIFPYVTDVFKLYTLKDFIFIYVYDHIKTLSQYQ